MKLYTALCPPSMSHDLSAMYRESQRPNDDVTVYKTIYLIKMERFYLKISLACWWAGREELEKGKYTVSILKFSFKHWHVTFHNYASKCPWVIKDPRSTWVINNKNYVL